MAPATVGLFNDLLLEDIEDEDDAWYADAATPDPFNVEISAFSPEICIPFFSEDDLMFV